MKASLILRLFILCGFLSLMGCEGGDALPSASNKPNLDTSAEKPKDANVEKKAGGPAEGPKPQGP